jgi:uncharacterized protein YndB with AHSA1/START domain/DNA-binding transcriptional ArsR family regulator
MPNQSTRLDAAFQALADPSRRGMLARLSRSPASVSELARPLRMSLPAVLQHLQVLEAGGLVRSEKKGRVRTCRIEPAALAAAEGWLAEHRALWEGRIDRLGSYLEELKAKEKTMGEATDLVLERVLDAPRELVWKAMTTPEHLKRWWAPRPYRTTECEIDLRPGGAFYTRMVGPDGFDSRGTSCILEVVGAEKIAWTNALLPGYRPAGESPADCGGFPFTAIMTLEDAGGGRTRYKAVALHRDEADRDAHEKMGFHDGWGTCAAQLAEVAAGLTATA